jgi:alkylhydroperoxidase family enzyme
MWLIPPVGDQDAEGALRELYDADLKGDGYVANTTRAWSYRPEIYALWSQLVKAIRSHLRLRTYELVVLAAARTIGCVY